MVRMNDDEMLDAVHTARDEVDPVLQVYVDRINALPDDSDDATSLTVHIDGLIVSGQLIGLRTWARDTANLVREWTGDVGRNAFDGLVDSLEEEARDHGLPPGRFIHLRRARAFTGASGVPDEGMLWRGRLDRVSGWHFGSMSGSGS